MSMPGFDEKLMKDRQFQYHNVIEKRYYSVNLSSVKAGGKR